MATIAGSFYKQTPGRNVPQLVPCPSSKDWLKIETLLRKVAKDETSKELRKISRLLYYILIKNTLLYYKIAGLKEVLKT